MIDIETLHSPGWWLARCARKLSDRAQRLQSLAAYWAGDPPLPEGAKAARAAYAQFQRMSRLNLADLIVSSLRERQRVRAIRTVLESGENGDPVAMGIYRENGLEVELAETLDKMLALGDAYMMVGLDAATPYPVITGEDPRQVVTIHDPVVQRRVRAALKLFNDPDYGMDYAYLYLPGRRYVARCPAISREHRVTFNAQTWSWDPSLGGADGEHTWDGVVPVTRFRNRRGIGEFEPHVDVLDRINHMILQRMVIATMQAFRQRAIKGDLPDVYPPGHPRAGEQIDYDQIFVADPGALWTIPAAADIWESGQVDLQGILSAIKDDIQALAAVSRRPLPILAPESANQSAAGANFAKESLTFAVEDRNARAGQALAQVTSHALLFMGETDRARLGGLSVEWYPAERYSLAEKGAAAQQAKAAGLPLRTILDWVWQADPGEIDRAMADRMDDMMLDFNAAVTPAEATA